MNTFKQKNHIDMIKRKEPKTHVFFGDFVSFLR